MHKKYKTLGRKNLFPKHTYFLLLVIKGAQKEVSAKFSDWTFLYVPNKAMLLNPIVLKSVGRFGVVGETYLHLPTFLTFY